MQPLISLQLLCVMAIQRLIPRAEDRATVAALIPGPLRCLFEEANFVSISSPHHQTLRQLQRLIPWPSMFGGNWIARHLGTCRSSKLTSYRVFMCIDHVGRIEEIKNIIRENLRIFAPKITCLHTTSVYSGTMTFPVLHIFHSPTASVEIHFKICPTLPPNILSLVHEICSLNYFKENYQFALSLPQGFVLFSWMHKTYPERDLATDYRICCTAQRLHAYTYERFKFVCRGEGKILNTYSHKFCADIMTARDKPQCIAQCIAFFVHSLYDTLSHLNGSDTRVKNIDILYQLECASGAQS